MVGNVTSLTGHGLRDWLVQRVSAVFIALYAVFLMLFCLKHSSLSYEQWQQLFSCVWMRIASMVVLLMLVLHAWVGVWTVTTDYLKNTCIRLFVQVLVLLVLLVCFIWGLEIFWGM